MPIPGITVNSINNIDVSAFVEKETNKLQNGTIRLGNSIYNVKFDKGNVNVKFKNWFLNLFNRNRSNEIKTKLLSKLKADKFVVTESFNFAKKEGAKPGVKQIVLYGMSEVRQVGKVAIDQANEELKKEGHQGFKATTIDTYNASINIEWNNVTKDPITMFSSIREGTIGNNMSEEDINGYGEVIDLETRTEWKQFLQDNADKVDIFKKIGKFINEGTQVQGKHSKKTGWASQVRKYGIDDTIKGFILKQMSPDARNKILKFGPLDKYVEIMKECAQKANEGTLTKEAYNQILDKAFPHHKEKFNKYDHHDDFYFRRDFGEVITNAFFRQTSKLGLEFFQSKGIKVAFQWSNKEGLNMNKEANKAELHNKWWLDKNYEKKQNKSKYGSITYSEMRHVERLTKKLGEKNMNVHKITGTTNEQIKSLL